jgi:hypothetical protein
VMCFAKCFVVSLNVSPFCNFAFREKFCYAYFEKKNYSCPFSVFCQPEITQFINNPCLEREVNRSFYILLLSRETLREMDATQAKILRSSCSFRLFPVSRYTVSSKTCESVVILITHSFKHHEVWCLILLSITVRYVFLIHYELLFLCLTVSLF